MSTVSSVLSALLRYLASSLDTLPLMDMALDKLPIGTWAEGSGHVGGTWGSQRGEKVTNVACLVELLNVIYCLLFIIALYHKL